MISKIKQHIFSLAFLVCFFAISAYWYGGEYIEYHENQKTYKQELETSVRLASDYVYSEATEIGETEFYYTPYKALLDTIVQKIDTAEKRIQVEVYIFTEKRIRESLVNASERGLQVEVLLEKNPYLAPGLNNKTFTILSDGGVDVRWSDADDYSLNHSKFLLIDDELILSTGNISYSTFTKNRDFLIFTRDSEIVSYFEKLFTSDFDGDIAAPYHEDVVLSPQYSRIKITKLITDAKESIDMYFQYLSDEEIENLLTLQETNGVEVRVILDTDFLERDTEKVNKLREKGWEIYAYKGTKMHAKAILVDDTALYIGSINFSRYSFDSNREVGIIIRDKQVIQKFIQIFTKDISFLFLHLGELLARENIEKSFTNRA